MQIFQLFVLSLNCMFSPESRRIRLLNLDREIQLPVWVMLFRIIFQKNMEQEIQLLG
jgi:hypothetical protein